MTLCLTTNTCHEWFTGWFLGILDWGTVARSEHHVKVRVQLGISADCVCEVLLEYGS